MNFLALAFFMGLLGSLHCAAMCGPLVLALPMAGRSKAMALANKMVYQIGRITVYGALGLAVGLAGNLVALKGWQQYISLLIGLVLLALALLQLAGARYFGIAKRQMALVAPLIRKMGYWLHQPGGNFIAGVCNGFLPCGMVYMALMAAFNADSVLNATLFMLLFGLGTLPMMTAVAITGSRVKRLVCVNIAKWMPVILLIMGVWFLLRGANWDIPYLSPLLYPEGVANCR
ncbi:hypothetical protein SAMN05421747_101460 [Parapedobacter composti]|uniref:Urease accessory protein UreH-like transmembrane domain-containing protein n=1 Tax=Parapedobacter composti TaxID=623281 RepID=A0A1I1EFV5_9SPHI|nr:sulfite exporter TauE/SafE family protein [Parapedobacter composti]SFB84208.1 hypothetical protein SAMN05421747_101460 [Parapedobacter composti]